MRDSPHEAICGAAATAISNNLTREVDVKTWQPAWLPDRSVAATIYTDGKSYDEAMEAIRDAIRLVVESRLAVGDPVPTYELMRGWRLPGSNDRR